MLKAVSFCFSMEKPFDITLYIFWEQMFKKGRKDQVCVFSGWVTQDGSGGNERERPYGHQSLKEKLNKTWGLRGSKRSHQILTTEKARKTGEYGV